MKSFCLCCAILITQCLAAQDEDARVFFKKLKKNRISMVHEGLRQIPIPENRVSTVDGIPRPLNDSMTQQLIKILTDKNSYISPPHYKEGTPACRGSQDVFSIRKDSTVYRLELDVTCHHIYIYQGEILIIKDVFLRNCEAKLWKLILRCRDRS